MGGTPEFLTDSRKGLYSYPALQTRLAENSFAGQGLVDYTGPVIRLANLSAEDLYVLLGKIRTVFTSANPKQKLIPDQGIQAFMSHCSQYVGEAYFRTPRNTIKAFVDLLAVLEQNEQTSWKDLVTQVQVGSEGSSSLSSPTANASSSRQASEDLATFRL